MKYQIGDRVLLLHSNEEADVIDIVNEKMLLVDVNGIQFPVYMDQVDFPYFKRFTEKKFVAQKKEKTYVDDLRKEKKIKEQKIEDGVWLSFLPVMDNDEFGDLIVEELKLHLLNHTSLAYEFTYKLHYFGKPDISISNTLFPFQDFYIQDIPFSHLNDSPSFEFDFKLTKPEKDRASHFKSIVRLKPKQLFAKMEELKQKNLATFTQLLFEKYPEPLAEDIIEPGILAKHGYKIYDASNGKRYLEAARSVIDLHIEKISNDFNGLRNYEILHLQMKEFEKYYHLAMVHHLPSLIVIHGVGEGVLRDEIHDILRLKKEVKSFVNQYHPVYGFGATEIFFKG